MFLFTYITDYGILIILNKIAIKLFIFFKNELKFLLALFYVSAHFQTDPEFI